MLHYSQDLISHTISVLEPRAGRAISKEDARQALENICGFFQMLNEWAAAETEPDCDTLPYQPAGIEEGKA